MVNDPSSAIQALINEPFLSAILVTDEALTLKKNTPVWEAVLCCVDRGSTAILMGQFSSFTSKDKASSFFAKAGLPWEMADYVRITVTTNPLVTGNENARKLPASYSEKAVFLKNVACWDSWYTTTETSVVESAVFAPENSHLPGASANVLTRFGDGRLGYIGDVNSEEETDAVILAMCGIL